MVNIASRTATRRLGVHKAAKGIGSTNWHSHDDQDEIFPVIEEARFLLTGPEVTSNAAGGRPDWSYTTAP